MTNKIFDFSQAYRKKHGEAPPIEGELLKESILNRLSQIPLKLAHEFGEGISLSIEEQLLYRDIILSSENPRLIAHLVDDLSEEQLRRLKGIVMSLVFFTGQKSIDKIANTLLNVSEATPKSILKGGRLFSLIEEMTAETAETIKEAIRLLGALATMRAVYEMEDLRPHIEDRLSRMSEDELDKLIQIARQI